MTIEIERAVQNRVIALLRTKLGYGYWGNLKDQDNGNINAAVLEEFLANVQKLTKAQISGVIARLKQAAHGTSKAALYKAKKEVYRMLRFPVPVPTEPGKPMKQAWLVDWKNPLNNIYSIAEEVSVPTTGGEATHRRPDVCLYVNGILFGVIELKKATVSIEEGVRQNWRNQQDGEIPGFFSTTQLLVSGSESEGIKYGTTLTPPKYWLKWKEPCGKPCAESMFTPAEVKNAMDRSILQMFEPKRFLGLVHDSIVFDAGVKKVMRPNQIFALDAAKLRIEKKESGIIWHTQGSGKSLMMVWLAQWIRENQADARVVIITDRDELDKQITNGFREAGEKPHQATSGDDLIQTLNDNKDWLITTLIHKFGSGFRTGLTGFPGLGEDENPVNPVNPVRKEKLSAIDKKLRGKPTVSQYMEQIAEHLPAGFKAKGNIYVFVDECHRTQGGMLNKAMKKIMGEGVMLIGFTGTPLLRVDKGELTSAANFGTYIHTYKFDEAVKDGVILDLRYEARDVEQQLKEDVTFDTLFDESTKSLTPRAKEDLKTRWANMQNLFSSKERITRIVADICKDMMLKPALKNGWGNAMLVCENVYQAFRYYDMFEYGGTPLKGRCAVVTSYDGKAPDLSEGYTGDAATEAEYKHKMAKYMFGDRTPEEFEEWAKDWFINHPGAMKLLIVVDKLLTGFDAPSCTYLYIDKKMVDHTLFQAICRVNRLNGENKDFGHIVDYKHLFENIQGAIEDYTNGAFSGYDKEDVAGFLTNDIEAGKRDLEEALEKCRALAEPVKAPKTIDEYFDWFCYDQVATPAEDYADELQKNAQKREDFYQACFAAVRAFAAIAVEIHKLYTDEEALALKNEVKDFDQIRDAIMKRCGDFADLKQFDAEMRALLDDYVTASHATKLGDLDNFSFLDVIKKDEDGKPESTDTEETEAAGGERGVAETMAANVRRYVFRKRETNPAEFRKFSERINRLLADYLQEKIEYKKFLEDMVKLCEELKAEKESRDPRIDTEAKKNLLDNLGGDVELALRVYDAVVASVKPGFRTNTVRRKKVEHALAIALAGTDYKSAEIYRIVERQVEFDGESMDVGAELM